MNGPHQTRLHNITKMSVMKARGINDDSLPMIGSIFLELDEDELAKTTAIVISHCAGITEGLQPTRQ